MQVSLGINTVAPNSKREYPFYYIASLLTDTRKIEQKDISFAHAGTQFPFYISVTSFMFSWGYENYSKY